MLGSRSIIDDWSIRYTYRIALYSFIVSRLILITIFSSMCSLDTFCFYRSLFLEAKPWFFICLRYICIVVYCTSCCKFIYVSATVHSWVRFYQLCEFSDFQVLIFDWSIRLQSVLLGIYSIFKTRCLFSFIYLTAISLCLFRMTFEHIDCYGDDQFSGFISTFLRMIKVTRTLWDINDFSFGALLWSVHSYFSTRNINVSSNM